MPIVFGFLISCSRHHVFGFVIASRYYCVICFVIAAVCTDFLLAYDAIFCRHFVLWCNRVFGFVIALQCCRVFGLLMPSSVVVIVLFNLILPHGAAVGQGHLDEHEYRHEICNQRPTAGFSRFEQVKTFQRPIAIQKEH